MTYYPFTNEINTKHFQSQTEYQVDIYLDLEIEELKICLVDDEREFELKGIPNSIDNTGWVPHFNLYYPDTKIRVAKIPIEWYRIPKKIEFE